LKSSGNIQEIHSVDKTGYITIDYDNLYKYAYLNMFKHYFPNHYLYGNLSPLIDKDKLENDHVFRDLMIMGLLLKNKRFSVLDYDNPLSILYQHGLMNDYRIKANALKSQKNIFSLFVSVVDGKQSPEAILSIISDYFENTYKKRP